jgi:hypothetical protein
MITVRVHEFVQGTHRVVERNITMSDIQKSVKENRVSRVGGGGGREREREREREGEREKL